MKTVKKIPKTSVTHARIIDSIAIGKININKYSTGEISYVIPSGMDGDAFVKFKHNNTDALNSFKTSND